MALENWILSEELVDWHQTAPGYQPWALFGEVNFLVVFPAHFNLHNYLLKLIQISPLFR